jgi:hypothetical protein
MGESTASEPVTISHDLLRAVRTGGETAGLVERLATLDEDRLAAATADDGAATAFWTNVYNAVTQLELERNPDKYDRTSFFGRKLVTVAGHDLSLDDIEHGILRRGYFKYGLGYVPNPFQRGFTRRMRITQRDWRVHFALNCGAASCPPIAAYTTANIDDELDLATESYLSQEVSSDPEAGRVEVPRLFLWYRGDFGGKSGILTILREFDCIPADASPKLSYSEYDWELALGQYRDREA